MANTSTHCPLSYSMRERMPHSHFTDKERGTVMQ